jgi:hypothetical protein
MNSEEARAKRFEAGQLFTPSAPVAAVELFAGRITQIGRIIDAIGERGRHIILFGERGVGKSSIATIVPFMIPKNPYDVRTFRIPAYPSDSFSILAKRIFQKIRFEADYGSGHQPYTVSQFYPDSVSIDDFMNEIGGFKETEIPIIIIDEFNEVEDKEVSISIANVIKALSDNGANVTIIIVGVSDSVINLVRGHRSIERCTEQIEMPRMSIVESKEVLDKRLKKLDMNISDEARAFIVGLAKGLPTYIHSLGRHTVYSALERSSTSITIQDVNIGIDQLLASLQQTLQVGYEAATRSNQARALFSRVLTACALAPCDEAGYFVPNAIRAPLSEILRKSVKIAIYQDALRDFSSDRRGNILERTGESRTFRFRFTDPAMQPYVLMKGIQGGFIPQKSITSFEQPELPLL